MRYGLWFIVRALWVMVYGLWFVGYGLWFMIYSLWFMALWCYGICRVLRSGFRVKGSG